MVITVKERTQVRPAIRSDLQRLANLVHYEPHVHRHLDWRPPLDWIGQDPYLVYERNDRLEAALVCPPDPPNVAWIRLFAVSADLPCMQAWEALWPVAFQQLANISGSILAAAIPLQNWFRDLLEQSEFICSHQVIVLAWRSAPTPKAWLVEGAKLRAMSLDDVSAVGQVDAEAFGSIWQNSLECIEIAFKQSAVATVCDIEGEIVGYQISTATPMGGHLARLAVKPAFQKRGIGHALAADLVSQFARRGAQSVTVNTQSNNLVSLSLYESIGFQKTGEEYPVYEQPIK